MRLRCWSSFVFVALSITGPAAVAQTASAAVVSAPDTEGVAPSWDIQKLIASLGAQAQHLAPLIDQVKPETWVAKGAPETYISQWKTTQAELKYFLAISQQFSKKPERLSFALETYFHMQAMDQFLGSLIEGIRRYQSVDLANHAQTLSDENSSNRERLRQYITDLSKQQEQEMRVMDQEAQRCRTTISHQPASRKR